MRSGDLAEVVEAGNAVQYLVRIGRMLFNDFEFFHGELRGLIENRIGYAEFTDVMQQGRAANRLHF